MPKEWKWSLTEALSVILTTYLEDWGRHKKKYRALLDNPIISEIQHDIITGLQSGKGQPVVFIHGSPANALRWQSYLENPPSGYQIIAIDRMGFGLRGNQFPNLEGDSLILEDFIGQFDNPIIVGHSLGGAHVTRLATQLKLKGVVLVASSIDPKFERILPVQRIANKAPLKWLLSRSIRHSNAEMMQLYDFIKETEKHLLSLKMPVHVVHANDDYLVPFANVAYAQNHFKDIHVTALEEGGHNLPWTHPEIVLRAIRSMS